MATMAGHSIPTWGEPPIHILDALFQAHDASDGGILADLALLNGMVALRDYQLDAEGNLYAGVAELGIMADLVRERYHFSAFEFFRDTSDAIRNIQIGLTGLDPAETSLFANWLAESAGTLFL